jgi:pantetheine-phosphate adenylyltransferase
MCVKKLGEAMSVVYPGSFDPVTYGHIDIINRAAKAFDEVIVAVLKNTSKKTIFSVEERMELLGKVKFDGNVKIKSFDGLVVDFLKSEGATILVKGLRVISDYEYECQMALTNKSLYPACDTFFIPAKLENSFLSSSIVREIASFGGDISGLVPPEIEKDIMDKYKSKQ